MKSRERIILSRKYERPLICDTNPAGEGGCGVVGFTSTKRVGGKHLLAALEQMSNRGNGKGGGVALLGLDASQFNISQEVLDTHYLVVIAYLNESFKEEIEQKYIYSNLNVVQTGKFETIEDFVSIDLEIRPPTCHYYFCRVQSPVLQEFIQKNSLSELPINEVEDEYIYQNSYLINRDYYSSMGDKTAFVLSHGKNLLVLKIVGFAHQVIKYYKLEKIKAHVWIGHHRYPTKGTVWHPGGAHPFIGLNQALVHNGDFANYHSMSEYLEQRKIYPQFLTDTEVAALQYDLFQRVYKYPQEYLIEALAPTTERDFLHLSEEKQKIYRKIQENHIHASPDGPWFFIVAQNNLQNNSFDLVGITDTSMLRPQVFALFEGSESIGLIASERQGIDAILESINQDDKSIGSKADIYWNARGGSHGDGGAFIFSAKKLGDEVKLECTNKFGARIEVPKKRDDIHILPKFQKHMYSILELDNIDEKLQSANSVYEFVENLVVDRSYEEFLALSNILDSFHLLPYSHNGMLRGLIEQKIEEILGNFSKISEKYTIPYPLVAFNTRKELRAPLSGELALVLDVSDFPPEGEDTAALTIVDAYNLGWKHVISFGWKGQRFCGSGLGPKSDGFRIDTYGNPGDYLASGLDGAEIIVHSAAQDQVGQIMRNGKLVIYGDVGQTFMYGAKGGEAYVLGNVAGRALINAGGSPKVIINGTALDYLAESFMAGDPLKKGGFVFVYGKQFIDGHAENLASPYPGSNLFSLASGGAIYIIDELDQLTEDQLHGGKFTEIDVNDWNVIWKNLSINTSLFSSNTIPEDFIAELNSEMCENKFLSYRERYPQLGKIKKIIPKGKVQ